MTVNVRIENVCVDYVKILALPTAVAVSSVWSFVQVVIL